MRSLVYEYALNFSLSIYLQSMCVYSLFSAYRDLRIKIYSKKKINDPEWHIFQAEMRLVWNFFMVF